MIYANSEEIYHDLYIQLQTSASPKQIKYFEKNWQPIKLKWVAYFRKNIVTLGLCMKHYFLIYLLIIHLFSLDNDASSRVEGVNSKVKSFFNKF